MDDLSTSLILLDSRGTKILLSHICIIYHGIQETVLALANITGNDMENEFEVDWRIFHVTLGENKFFKVLYTGKKVGKLHPGIEKKIREHFDKLSKLELNDLMREYREKQSSGNFRKVDIKELKEEYDLWQDKFWLYF